MYMGKMTWSLKKLTVLLLTIVYGTVYGPKNEVVLTGLVSQDLISWKKIQNKRIYVRFILLK